MRNQGVMDGCFPSVTFSKESKKIVTLTQKEITSRLTNLLQSLSACGCLGVLLATLDDRDDLIVVKKGVDVIRTLMNFFDVYHYLDEPDHMTDQTAKGQPKVQSPTRVPAENILIPMESDAVEVPDLVNQTEMDNAEGVIQSIVSAKDVDLLSKAYENQLNFNTSSESHTSFEDSKNYFKLLSSVSAHTFLHRVKSSDLNGLIKVRTDWLAQTESFSSLLNDMMYSLQAHELYDADCY